jgi:hypothetical protein
MITAVPREVSVISRSGAGVRADAKPYTSFISPYQSAETQSFASRIRPEQMQNVTQRVLLALLAGAYAVLVAFTIHHHEPWADEAQSWLLGRDASLAQLWGHLLRYEGTPGLWQTLLHALIRLGLRYSDYSFVSASLGLAAVVLVLRYAPLPIYIRILLPFTYFLCYQYAIIARSYALIAPLLFAIAVLYSRAPRRPALITALLALLAGVSVHGFLISACIWITLYGPMLLSRGKLQPSERRTVALAGLIYWSVLVFYSICAWPANDVAFAEHRGLANLHLLPEVAKAGVAGAFTGYWITSLVLIALSLPVLWRGGGWLFFLLSSAAFCLFGTVVYAQLWHFGMLFLAWLFAIWISAYKTRLTAPTLLALIAAIGFQCYWTAAAIRYDWTHAYSGSLATAQYLRQAGLPSGGLYAIGYPTVAVQPYFSANIFSDYHGGAYWDWSKRNTANDPSALFASDRREMVLVGYKNLSEKQHWADLLALLGYGITENFDGNTFWQTGVFEFESYDLYRKTSEPRATSSVNMADPALAAQLLNGFYGIEGGKSRWTAKNFSVLLKAPPGSEGNGAELTLKLYIPEVQIRSLGAITLSADAGGHELPSRIFSQSNEYIYSAHVAAEALRSGFAAVNFRLDKSAIGLNGDARELGVVVTEVGLAPPSPGQ